MLNKFITMGKYRLNDIISFIFSNDVRYWLIVKPSESDNIVLDFRTFSVEEATDCIYDYVSIYDGKFTLT